MSGSSGKRKEIYKYVAPFNLYSMNWSVRPDKRFRLALGSFVEEYNNKVQIISLDEDTSEFSAKSTFDHPYPTTKIMWIPDSKGIFPDLLATSGDYLRVWRAGEPETRMECVLNNNKNSGKLCKYFLSSFLLIFNSPTRFLRPPHIIRLERSRSKSRRDIIH